METYKAVESLKEPLIVVDNVDNAMNGDLCKIQFGDNESLGQVIAADGKKAIVEVFSPIQGYGKTTSITFEGRPFHAAVSEHILGRVFNALGQPIDGGKLVPDRELPVYSSPINPTKREKPQEFVETGISAIDGLNSLVIGQKLPVFSGSGMPGGDLALQIVEDASLNKEGKFAVLFGTMGATERDVTQILSLLQSPSADHIAVFINRAGDPVIERLLLPRIVLTNAEYLAFEKDYTVLVVLSDMLTYADALRQISSQMEQIPGRRGYPANLYTDLATIYERCGRVKGKKGSITLVPVLTMPSDDITHPVPDLSGYITEGQIVLSRELFNKKIYPPVSVQLSLSRLMDNGIGDGLTREDHRQVANQLYYAVSKATDARNLSTLIGESALSEEDKEYLKFLDDFEKRFIHQERTERRDIITTLNIAWDLMAELPSLPRIDKELIKKYGVRKDKS